MLCNNNAQNAQPQSFLIHPHDPCVEKEYESLIRAWKNQLIDTTPTTPNNDYVRFAWMRLMDHYLNQQWLDSKQMLQCAQAWCARDELSLTEAVHTMNILGLKSMQRSLDARQELLQVLGDPDLMAGFGIQQPQQRFSTSTSSLTGSEQVHAPLLVKHNNNDDEAIVTTTENDIIKDSVGSEIINLFVQAEEEEIKPRYVFEEYEEQDISPFALRNSISSSISSPNISSISKITTCFATRKYESYYQKVHQTSSWKEIEGGGGGNSDLLSENGSSSSMNSEISSPLLGSGVQWKSWFLGEQATTFTEEFANEKVETDASFAEFKQQNPFLMVRSESSMSAFRPISNNLAPRCNQPAIHERISSEEQHDGLLIPPMTAILTSATITKSTSFPTKVGLSASIKKPFISSSASASPTNTIPHQQQRSNFMIRSIVNKKASLSKLFASKKSSSSSLSSST